MTPTRIAAVYARLKNFAAKGGVRVVELPCQEMYKLPVAQLCPFLGSLGIDWEAKVLYVDPSDLNAQVLGGMIHELGHLVAINEEPKRASELDFLGWESIVARKLRMFDVWETSMKDYSMSDGEEYGSLKPEERGAELARALEEGTQLKNLTKNHQPLFVR